MYSGAAIPRGENLARSIFAMTAIHGKDMSRIRNSGSLLVSVNRPAVLSGALLGPGSNGQCSADYNGQSGKQNIEPRIGPHPYQ